MNGTIANFRRARHHQTTNQMIVLPERSSTKDAAAKLVGKKVSWKTPSGKQIIGTITAVHGRNGAVKVLFETGMPGQAIGTNVAIE